MNLKQLEVFVAVAESGSFSKGAETAFITQSTVSQHISALEKEFGVRLLDRTGKGALLTEGGKIMLQQARRVIAAAHEIKQAMNRFKGVEDVTLKVGGSTIPGDYMVPAALPVVLERFPGMKIVLLQGDSREILDKIAREEVEVGIIGTRFDDEGFSYAPLGEDVIRLIVDGRHRWAKRRSIDLEELQTGEFVLREAGSGTGKTVVDALAAAGLNPGRLNVRAYLGSNEAVKHAVAGGLGVSFLSVISVGKEVERRELAEVQVKGLEISRQFYLTSREGRELSPAASAFARIMREIYGE